MSRIINKPILVTSTAEVSATTETIVSIFADKISKYIVISLQYADSSGTVVSNTSRVVSGNNYELLMSLNPTFATNKPVNEFRESDVCFILDYIDADSPALWVENTTYATGDIRYYGKNIYTCMTAGVSGTTAPTATGGTVTDGTVVWTFKETLG